MASLKEMRSRIGSVKATQKITKAMQMVAAAKLKRAQEAAESARPYAQRMSTVIANLASGVDKNSDTAPALLVGPGPEKNHLLVVATADRGLCGGFNTNIVRLAREKIAELEAEGKTVKIICVGKKGRDQLKRIHGDKIVQTFDMSGVKRLSLADVQPIADKIMEMFDARVVDVVSLIHAQFKSVISQVPVNKSLIPADVSQSADLDLQGAAYEYEPDETEILETLLPRNLSTQLLSALLENAAGEQGSRMQAMDNATRNAGDMIDALTLQYNRTRQAQITKELIEIISGAEAL